MVRTLSFLLVVVWILTTLSCTPEPAAPTVSLYRALHTGDLDQVRRHLYWKTDISQPDANGDYPLHVLARANRVIIARAILDHGADPEQRNAAGETPLEVALQNGKTQFARLLVEYHAHFDPQALFDWLVATGNSDRDVYACLIRNGAAVDHLDADGESALHLAVAQRRITVVSRLIESGANVNLKDSKGRTPLDLVRSQQADFDTGVIEQILRNNGAESTYSQ